MGSVLSFLRRFALDSAARFFSAATGGNIARAQEDCAWPNVVKTVTLQINDCMFDVDVCVYCGAVTHPTTDVKILEFRQRNPNCQTGLSLQGLVDAIYANILNPAFIYTYLCELDPDPSPCPNGGRSVASLHYYWWDAERIIDPTWGWEVLRYFHCEEAACEETVYWRLAGAPPNTYFEKTIVSRTPRFGVPTCPTNPYPQLPTKLGEQMGCMRVNWVCP